jgi:hypothetical protein
MLGRQGRCAGGRDGGRFKGIACSNPQQKNGVRRVYICVCVCFKGRG